MNSLCMQRLPLSQSLCVADDQTKDRHYENRNFFFFQSFLSTFCLSFFKFSSWDNRLKRVCSKKDEKWSLKKWKKQTLENKKVIKNTLKCVSSFLDCNSLANNFTTYTDKKLKREIHNESSIEVSNGPFQQPVPHRR